MIDLLVKLALIYDRGDEHCEVTISIDFDLTEYCGNCIIAIWRHLSNHYMKKHVNLDYGMLLLIVLVGVIGIALWQVFYISENDKRLEGEFGNPSIPKPIIQIVW